MRTLFIISILITIAVAIYAMAPWSKDVVSEKIQDLDQTLQNQVSDDYVVNGWRQNLNKEITEIQDKSYYIEEQRNNLLNKEALLEKDREQLAEFEGYLQKSVSWIESHTPTDILLVGGKEYDYNSVLEDAKTRANECNNLRQIIEAKEEGVKLLRSSIKQASDLLQKRYIAVKQKLANLGAKEMELLALRELEKTQAAIKSLNMDAINKSDKYEQTVKERVGKMKARLEFNSNVSKGANIVDYPSMQTKSDLDVAKTYIQTYIAPPALQSATS